jgi:hypothetical protein
MHCELQSQAISRIKAATIPIEIRDFIVFNSVLMFTNATKTNAKLPSIRSTASNDHDSNQLLPLAAEAIPCQIVR